MEINTENKASSESPSSESYSKTTKTSPFGSVWNGLRNLFSNKTTAIAGVLVLVLGLGAGVVAVQRSTEYRQQAAWVPTKPSTPILAYRLYCKTNESRAMLSWNSMDFVSGYRVYQWNTPKTGTWNLIHDTLGGKSTTYDYTSLRAGSGYTLRMTAYNSSGESNPSNSIGFTATRCPAPTATPRPIYTIAPLRATPIPTPTKAPLPPAASQPPSPLNLKATCTSNTSVNLTWAAVSGVTGYTVTLRSPSGNTGIGTATNSQTRTVTAGTIYSWEVKACTNTACSKETIGTNFFCGPTPVK